MSRGRKTSPGLDVAGQSNWGIYVEPTPTIEETPMDRDDLLRKLESLAQLDTDAVQVYSDAIGHVSDDDVLEAFKRFQEEHSYHAQQLSEMIVRLGSEKPRLAVDLMGRMADWVTEFRSMTGTRGALRAMKTAEHYHNRHYGEAATWDVGDDEIATMLSRFDEDEKRHLAFVEERLAEHVATGGGAK